MDIFSNLSPKQACFCNEYFKDFNATKAALRAGYSPATALNGKLMTLPKIKYHLQQRGAVAAEQAMVSAQMVLAELKKIAFAEMGEYFGADGNPLPMYKVNGDARAALGTYAFTENKNGSTTVRIRMSNKLAALEKIIKHIKFYDNLQPDITHSNIDTEQLDDDDRYDDASMAPKAAAQNDDDDYLTPTEEEINNWIEDARQQAIYETEKRLRLEYEMKGSRGDDAGNQKTDKMSETSVVANSPSPKGSVAQGIMTGNGNTDKYHPPVVGRGPDEQLTLVRTRTMGIKLVPVKSVKEWGRAVRWMEDVRWKM